MALKLLVLGCTLILMLSTLFLTLHTGKTSAINIQDATQISPTETILISADIRFKSIYIAAETDPDYSIALLKKFIADEPTFMNQCHEIAHEIGHVAYEHFGRDAFSYKDPFCGAGYLHGMLERATIFDETMSLAEIVHTICTGEIEESCIHGLGHAIYKTAQDVPKAIAYCDQALTSNKDCYDGVYMELFDTKDGLKPIALDEGNNICPRASDTTRPSCLFYLPRILKGAEAKDVTNLCTSFTIMAEREVCAEGTGVMFMKYAAFFDFDAVIQETCTYYVDETLKRACETGARNYFTYGNVTNTEW